MKAGSDRCTLSSKPQKKTKQKWLRTTLLLKRFIHIQELYQNWTGLYLLICWSADLVFGLWGSVFSRDTAFEIYCECCLWAACNFCPRGKCSLVDDVITFDSIRQHRLPITRQCEATIIYTELEIDIIGKMHCVTRLQGTVQIAGLHSKVVNSVL